MKDSRDQLPGLWGGRSWLKMGSFGKNGVFIRGRSDGGLPSPRALSPVGARERDAGPEAGAPMKDSRDQLPGLWGGRSWLKMGSFGKNGVFIRGRSDGGLPSPRALSPVGARERDAGPEAGAPMKDSRDQLPGLWGGRSWLKMGSFGKNGVFIRGRSDGGLPSPRALSPVGARERDAGPEAGAPMKDSRDQLPGLWGGRSWLKMGSFGKN